MLITSFTPFRDRDIEIYSKYKVYRNLNNSQFSLLAMSGEFKGLVVGHANYIELSDVDFTISEKSRLRAVKEKTRNVHAFAIGKLMGFEPSNLVNRLQQITYNPFQLDRFIYVHNSKPLIYTEKLILIHNNKVCTLTSF